MMIPVVYDGSFEGFLTAVFEIYERRLETVSIIRRTVYQPLLCAQPVMIVADEQKGMRVWTGLKKKISVKKCNELYKAFLSEKSDVENTILAFIRYAFSSTENVAENYGHPAVLAITQIAKQVHREKHRMEAFVRFKKTADNLYFSTIAPDFNVLPLIASHFKDRYADQSWLIYDRKRNYGIQYDTNSGIIIELQPDPDLSTSIQKFISSSYEKDENAYQLLWQQYFKSININARNNHKLHLRHVPVRYWKYLTEKSRKD